MESRFSAENYPKMEGDCVFQPVLSRQEKYNLPVTFNIPIIMTEYKEYWQILHIQNSKTSITIQNTQ